MSFDLTIVVALHRRERSRRTVAACPGDQSTCGHDIYRGSHPAGVCVWCVCVWCVCVCVWCVCVVCVRVCVGVVEVL